MAAFEVQTTEIYLLRSHSNESGYDPKNGCYRIII